VINALDLNTVNLPPAAAGMNYIGWLLDKERGVSIRLGRLAPASNATSGQWTLHFQNDVSSPSLLYSGDKRLLQVLVNLEPIDATQATPTGTTVLFGQVPAAPFFHVQHLLVGHPVIAPPGHVIRLLRQAQILVEEPLAQLFLAIDGVYPQWEAACAAQSILDMIEGKSGSDYRPLPMKCTYAHLPVTQVGDGYGIENHLRDILAHVESALESPGITSDMTSGAHDLRRDANDLKGWYDTAAAYAREIVNGSNVHARDMRALCENALQGDLDTGQGGVYQAYAAAQRMATITLTTPK
jgi:hypothetical protein